MENNQQNAAGRKLGHNAVATVAAAVDPDELIENREAAALLRVRPQTLAAWRVEKRGPRWLKVGRRVLYRRTDISAWLTAQLSAVEAA
jgi:predicted DNA-binding transcriptional regulator AlpA